MNLLDRFLNRIDYSSYDDFKQNLKLTAPKNFNFALDVVDEYAKICPEKRALVWCNDLGEEKILTFSDMKEYSDKTATILLRHGIKRGDFIMTMLNRRYEYYFFVLACMKIGAVIVPATYMLTPKDISYRVNSAKIKLIVTINEDEVITHVREAMPNCETQPSLLTIGGRGGFINFSNELKECEVDYLPERSDNNETMLVYFTSGTTGFPKMVAHKYTYPLGFIINAKYWQGVEDDGLHLTMAETGWAKFSWGQLYGQWIAGTAIFCYDYFGKFTPTDILPLIEKYKLTTFCVPPTIYRFLIKEDLRKFNLSSLHRCTTAGEPLNPEIFKQFYDSTGLEICEGFGQTETSVLAATFDKMITPKLGSMGKASPIYDMVIIDDDFNELSDNEIGELCVRMRDNQLGLTKGYYNDDVRTENVFLGGYFHTGDQAYRDKDGFFWFVGRKDDIIKSSGYRIGPFEVESALHEHPSVLECAITAVPDPMRGQIVKATIVLAKGYTPSEELKHALQDHVKHATAPYKYPRIIEFVEELPKTISGKIQRNVIRNKDTQ